MRYKAVHRGTDAGHVDEEVDGQHRDDAEVRERAEDGGSSAQQVRERGVPFTVDELADVTLHIEPIVDLTNE